MPNGKDAPGHGLTSEEVLRNSPEARAKAERAAKRGAGVGQTKGNDGTADSKARKQRARDKSGQFISTKPKDDKSKGGKGKKDKKAARAAAGC